ncbi:MAG: O-antigen ligase family protein [Verrucomicrobiota bacterium]
MINLSRILTVYAIAIPLALLLGRASLLYGLSDPDLASFAIISLVLFVLALPFLLHSYLPILLFCWNATLIAFFLPGAPAFWMVMTFASFLLLVVQRGISPNLRFLSVPSLNLPLLLLAMVVVITAAARGGIGLHALGSSMSNGRKYVELLAAIAGYFVLSSQEIPRKRAALYASLFFAGGVTPALADLIYVAGSKFYWLYNLFSSQQARALAGSESLVSLGIFRIEGVSWASVAFCCFMLVRYGIKGILDPRRPWRLLLLLAVFVVGLFGGYRSRLFLIGMFFLVQFFLEGLWRTWLMPVVLVMVAVAAGVVFAFSDRLPEAVQRSVSFLPGVKVESAVVEDAAYSVQWREDMWREVVPQIPTYFWLGKGYGFTENDLFVANQMVQSGMAPTYDPFILAGEYHSGPLSLLLPLGIFGTLAFVWFLIAGWRAVWRNYRFGDPDLRLINTFLLTFYMVRAIYFFSIFGALETDLAFFAGTAGLSVALNGGLRQKKGSNALRREAKSLAVGQGRVAGEGKLIPVEV